MDENTEFARPSGTRPQTRVGGVEVTPRHKELVKSWIPAGPMMSRFEHGLAAAHDCRFELMCNSGVSALQIVLAALKERYGWQDGDEVLVPAATYVAL